MKKKNIAIELMRVISMLMIVAYHWQIHACNDGICCSPVSPNQIFSFLVGSWGTLGVNIFFIISAYFLIKSKNINMEKAFLLVGKVSIYGTAVVLIANSIGIVPFNIITFIKSVLGVFAFQYWFISVYVVLYILHPALNSILESSSEQYLRISLLTIIISTYFVAFASGNLFLGRLACGLCIYLTIGYLEKYPQRNFLRRYGKIAFPVLFLGILGTEIVLSHLGTNYNPLFHSCIRRLQDTHSPVMFFTSLCMFYSFVNIQFKENRVILFLGKMSVGAYMIHGGASFIKDILWDKMLNACQYYKLSLFAYGSHYIGSVLFIFTVGILAELIYTNTFEKILKYSYRKLQIIKQRV